MNRKTLIGIIAIALAASAGTGVYAYTNYYAITGSQVDVSDSNVTITNSTVTFGEDNTFLVPEQPSNIPNGILTNASGKPEVLYYTFLIYEFDLNPELLNDTSFDLRTELEKLKHTPEVNDIPTYLIAYEFDGETVVAAYTGYFYRLQSGRGKYGELGLMPPYDKSVAEFESQVLSKLTSSYSVTTKTVPLTFDPREGQHSFTEIFG